MHGRTTRNHFIEVGGIIIHTREKPDTMYKVLIIGVIDTTDNLDNRLKMQLTPETTLTLDIIA